MIRWAALALLFLCGPAWAQNAVIQNGSVTPGHIMQWAGDRTAQDPGGLTGRTATGVGLSPHAITDGSAPTSASNVPGLGLCFDSASTLNSVGYNAFCFGHDSSGNGLITLDSNGALSAKTAYFRKNGTLYEFPFIGTGVQGPVSTTVDDLACWNNTSGTLLRDCGKTYAADALGFVGDGSTSNAAAFATLFARTDSPQVVFPSGTYLIPCGTALTAASSIGLRGVGKGKTIIQLAAGCVLTQDIFKWADKGGVQIKDLTLDLNGMADTIAQVSAMAFYVTTAANISGPTLDTMEIINGRSPTTGGAQGVFLVRMSIQNASGSFLMPTIRNSRFQMTPSAVRNAAISMGGDGSGNSTAPPYHHYAKITGNTLQGGGLEIGGDNPYIAGNDISGFQFGTGIFTEYEIPVPSARTNTHDCIIIGNTIHDTNAGLDSNSTAAGGIENNCVAAKIANNNIYKLGGEGIRNYADYTSITGNVLYDNAKDTTVIGNYSRAGISLVSNIGTAPYNSKSVFLGNNQSYDSGAATQLYGMADQNGILGPVIQQGNEFAGPTAATLQNSVQGTWAGDPWQDYTPTLSCTAGTLTSATAAGSYRWDPNGTVWYSIQPAITTNGTCATTLVATLPALIPAYTSGAGMRYTAGGENVTTGTAIQGVIASAGTTISLRNYDASYPGADATTLNISGVYRTIP